MLAEPDDGYSPAWLDIARELTSIIKMGEQVTREFIEENDFSGFSFSTDNLCISDVPLPDGVTIPDSVTIPTLPGGTKHSNVLSVSVQSHRIHIYTIFCIKKCKNGLDIVLLKV